MPYQLREYRLPVLERFPQHFYSLSSPKSWRREASVCRHRQTSRKPNIGANKSLVETAHKGERRKRLQLKTKMEDEPHWTKRSRETRQIIDQKKDPAL
jgi:hypothetical protein